MNRIVILLACLISAQASIYPIIHGIPWAGKMGKIVGGVDIPISEAPWSASILVVSGSALSHTCGGSVISPTVVLTAAHCLVRKKPENLRVRVGSATNNEGGQLIEPSIVLFHANFSAITAEHDIGLLFLSEPITIDTTSPIRLPLQGDTVEDDSEAVNTGWGRLSEDGPAPTALQSVLIQIINQDVCKASARATVTSGMICAGVPEGGKGSCNGDSGGPLTVDNTLVGLTSWSEGCVRPGKPTVYTRVASYIDWIQEQQAIHR